MFYRFIRASRFHRALMAWPLLLVLALQFAAPVTVAPRRGSDASERLAALASVVGHPVATCHDDDGQMPAGDAEPCCPCVLCHAVASICPAVSVEIPVVRPPVVVGVASFPQPPPRAPAFVLSLSGPRGPPLLA